MLPDPRKGVAAVDCCPTPGTIFAARAKALEGTIVASAATPSATATGGSP